MGKMKKLFGIGALLAAWVSCCAADGGDFILVKGGAFTMGSPESEAWRERDEAAREVEVEDFLLAKCEVSQGEYQKLMGANPSEFKGEKLPVENVTWYDAVRFCNAKSESEGLRKAYSFEGEKVVWNRDADGYRLPTEAEWEYACRAGGSGPFNFGRFPTSDLANYYATYPYEGGPSGTYRGRTMPVDSFKPNGWGFFNMHGNVAEWCWDAYGDYGALGKSNPAGDSGGKFRVCRGGGWNDFGKHLRSAFRSAAEPESAMYNRGFRLARSAAKK